MAVLAVIYPGRRIRHISWRPEQLAVVQRQLHNFQQVKAGLEEICELNQRDLRAGLTDSKSGRRNRD